MTEFYNRHYVTIRQDGVIIDAWSDGPHPEKDISNAICINDEGTYQFRFDSTGEENPYIYTDDGIPLYRLDDKTVIPRSDLEIEIERNSATPPPPSLEEQLRADIDFIAAMIGVIL